MTLTGTITALGAISQSGCLLGKQVVADDASLTPLVPPSIIEEMIPIGSPLPGATIQLASPTTPTNFQVAVYRQQGLPLEAHWFLDRYRPCTGGSSCGVMDIPGGTYDTSSSSITNVSTRVELAEGIAAGCHWVDLYLSGAFRSDDEEVAHLPVVTGDIAHARWFLIVPGTAPNACPTSMDGQNQ